MENESVATSDSLFGADGTQLPDPWPPFADSLTAPEPTGRPAAGPLPPPEPVWGFGHRPPAGGFPRQAERRPVPRAGPPPTSRTTAANPRIGRILALVVVATVVAGVIVAMLEASSGLFR